MKCYNGSSFLPDDLHGSKARTMLPKAECLRDLTDVHATENQNGFLFTSQFTQTSVTQTYATWLISSREFFTALRASPRRGVALWGEYLFYGRRHVPTAKPHLARPCR